MATATPGEPQRFELDAVSIDVRERALRLTVGAFVVSLLTVVPLAALVSPLLGFLPLGTAALWLVLSLLPRLRSAGPGTGALEIDGGTLTLTVDAPGRARVQHRFIAGRLARGFRTDDEVRLETSRGETLALSIDSVATGEAILRALGLDARRRVLEVPIASIGSRVPGGVALAWTVLILQSPFLLMFPIALLLATTRSGLEPGTLAFLLPFGLAESLVLGGAIRAVQRRSAAIGMDGIVFRRFLRRRFYPYSAIADVTLAPGGVAFTLRSGKRVRLRTRGFWSRSGVDEAARALFERIETARAAASGHDVRAKLPLLERRSRSAAEWRAHLSTLIGAAGYRTGAVTARDLVAVIEDAALSAEHRIAATLALAAAEPEEARTRARFAAAACADKGLRVALDHAAEGELDEEELARLTARGG